jgi:hypothetical protein
VALCVSLSVGKIDGVGRGVVHPAVAEERVDVGRRQRRIRRQVGPRVPGLVRVPVLVWVPVDHFRLIWFFLKQLGLLVHGDLVESEL